MTTPTTTPAVPITSTIVKDYDWVKAHIVALVVTIGLLAALTFGAVYGVENLVAKHDLAAQERADAQLSAQVAQTKAAQDALALNQQQMLVLVQQVTAQNAQLAQSMAQRNVQNAKQQKVDASLNASDAANRLARQTNAAPGDITTAGDSITLSLPITRRVVGDEDALVKSQADLHDTTTELANETLLFNKSQEVVAAQTKLIADLTAQNLEQVKACAAEVKTVKAQARKSKLKIGAIAYVFGVITGYGLHLI